jgi:YfiH family protein
MLTTTLTSQIGRIVVPDGVPNGFALYYTTSDFPGRLSAEAVRQLGDVTREQFAIEATLTTCNQVHGAAVRRGKRETEWRECDSCDALYADARGTALGIKAADCLPVTFIDAEHGVIANVHSGWRGATQRIVDETINALAAESAFSPAATTAWLGPAIRACCFEVGEEVVAEFTKTFGDAERYVDRGKAKPHLDLAAVTRDVLRARGIATVHDTELCTRCDGSIFHSYRRNGANSGRNLAVVGM